MLRRVLENDYGIDFLLELTSASGEVDGSFFGIQLKGSQSLSFNREGKGRHYGIKSSTYSYWLKYAVPVMLILVDVSNSQIYISSVEDDFRRNYGRYIQRDSDTVTFEFSQHAFYSPDRLIFEYQRAKSLRRMDNELPALITIYERFLRLHTSRYRRDGHMPVDGDGSYDPSSKAEVHQYERLLRRLFFDISEKLELLGLPLEVSIEDIINDNRHQNNWGDEMYEAQFTAILDFLDVKLMDIIGKTREIIGTYQCFWSERSPELVAFVSTVQKTLSDLYWNHRSLYFSLVNRLYGH